MLRNQAKGAFLYRDDGGVDATPAPTSISTNCTNIQTKTMLSANVETPSVWGTFASDIGNTSLSSGENEDEDLGDLLQMLEARDGLHESTIAPQKLPWSLSNTIITNTSRFTSEPTTAVIPCQWLPVRKLAEVEDPYMPRQTSVLTVNEPPVAQLPGTRRGTALEGESNGDEDEEEENDVDDDNDEDGDDDEYISAISSTKVEALLQSYLLTEDDEEVLAALGRASSHGSTSVDISVNSNQNKPQTANRNDTVVKGDKTRGNVTTLQGNNSHVCSTSPAVIAKRKHQAERQFQRITSWYPHQVLRYAYGGSPLWCTLPIPSYSVPVVASGKAATTPNPTSTSLAMMCPTKDCDIPHCESCGARRVFEFQLMPALLSQPWHLQRSDRQSTATPSEPVQQAVESTENNQLKALLNSSGIDFGVVAVFVCPMSCESGVREIAVVQPPCDL